MEVTCDRRDDHWGTLSPAPQGVEVLRAEGLSKRFGGLKAVQDVSFTHHQEIGRAHV